MSDEQKRSELAKRIEARLRATGLIDEDQRLDPALVKEFEPLLGREVKDIRIHRGPRAAMLTQSVGARALAFASGDIFFAPGEFQPHTVEGKALIAHELTHVVEGHVGASGAPTVLQPKEAELRAKRVEEMVIAKEEKPKRESERAEEPAELLMEGAGEKAPKKAVIDKHALEEKTYEILQKLIRVERERGGHF